MKEIFSINRKHFSLSAEAPASSVLGKVPRRAICFLGLFCFCAQTFCAEEMDHLQDPLAATEDQLLSANTKSDPIEASRWSLFRSSDVTEDRYTINFNNVAITEYIRFVSKITGKNFIFQDQELQFTVTIVSEEPITVKNILSALVQTLRIHNLTLLEQDNSYIITASREVTQMPPVVSAEHAKDQGLTPIITRVFRIKNANINSVAAIIRPMTSMAAIVEVSPETRQLIVTDIATNIDKIASLLTSIDSPHSPLEIEIYKAKHLPSQTLIDLTKQIVTPFAEANPLIYVSQGETNSIFIVSTPYLIERSVEVMEDLDVEPKTGSEIPMTNEKVFLYSIQAKTPEELIDALQQIAKNLQSTGASSYKLVTSIKSVKWIKDSNALLFITDSETEPKLLEIVKALDSVSPIKNFYVYKIQQAGVEQIERALRELGSSIKKTSQDKELIDAIYSMKYIKETNSLIFTGPDEALKKLADLLPTFDVGVAQFSPSSHYWIYSPQYLSGKELKEALKDINNNLESSGLSNKPLLQTLDSMKWVPSTNTLIFTGDPNSLENIQAIIKLIDIPSGSPSKIFLYNPKYVSREQIEEALDELAEKLDAKNLTDRNLAKAIDEVTWVAESQSFLFKADPATIEKIEGFLKDIDNPKEAEVIAYTFYLYNLKYASAEQVAQYLNNIADSLPKQDLEQKAVIETIHKIDNLKEANSLLLKGTQKAVEIVKNLIAQFDVPQSKPASFEKTEFFIYKPQHLSEESLKAAMQETANDLKESGLIDSNLLQSIQTMRFVDSTGSFVFTGTKESLEKTRQILNLVDTPTTGEGGLAEIAGHTFLIYKSIYVPSDKLLEMLKTIALNLQKADPAANKDLLRSIESAKLMKETNSILFTGAAATLEKIRELMKQIDLPAGATGEVSGRTVSTYATYKPLNVDGKGLIDIVTDFEQNLIQSGVNEPQLFETINNLRYIDKTGYILVSGDQESVKKVVDLLKKFDLPSLESNVSSISNTETSFLVYKLQYHPGTEIQTALKQIAQDLNNSDGADNKHLMNAVNSLQWIKITNSLVATGTPEVLVKLKELVQNLDVPLRQVFIEVLIIQTTLFNNQQFGIQWGSKVQYMNKFGGGFGNFPSPNSATSAPANNQLATPLATVSATSTPTASQIPVPINSNGGFDLGVIGDIILHKGRSFISLGSLVNALQQDNDSVIVMNPKIIAQDSQLSNIFVGQNIPFVGSTVQTTGLTQQTAANIEYRDVGVNLSITPILGTNDIVTLDISNDITSQVANTTTGVNGVQGLQTAHTSLSARVHVPNNHFVALSGMLQDEKDHFKSAIPCLGGLPLIGAAFSENDRSDTKNSVIFFIRPTIIDSFDEYKKLTEHQEQLFKEVHVLPVMKEEIDDAIDWVKTPENE